MGATAKVKFDVTSNSGRPRNSLERDALQSYRELESAEKSFEPGLRFGQAMIDLNLSLEHGQWIDTLERLGITYRKAQYWMHIRKGETPTGSKKKPGADDKNKVAFGGWEAASRWLIGLSHKVAIIKKQQPKGAFLFAQELSKLAAELRAGYNKKKGGNHALVLQRVGQRNSRVATRTHKGKAHTRGGRR
ncbi:MAG: hypothetical protein ACJ72H_04825 [Candidatus Sulfotelmatobacter sp.]